MPLFLEVFPELQRGRLIRRVHGSPPNRVRVRIRVEVRIESIRLSSEIAS